LNTTVLAFLLLKNDTPSTCESWQQFNIQLGIAALFFAIGTFFFFRGRAGKIRFTMFSHPKSHQRFAVGVAIFLWSVAAITLLSTLFGWGC
jgi:hypothetical protein